jgi:hypothetical protein
VPEPHDLSMGSDTALFPNVAEGLFLGDGACLLDRNTSMRNYYEYPCVLECSGPLQGVLQTTKINAVATAKTMAKRANQQYLRIRNDGLVPALLAGYYLMRGFSTYPFLVNSVVEPGRSLTVRIGKGTPTRLTQYWGRESTLLSDGGDRVALMSNRNVTISAKAWGRR